MNPLAKYQRAVKLEHGWEVELTCSACGHRALPRYDGWEPSRAIHFGNTPTLYANVACEKCGHDLREAAGEQLVAMFSDVAVPKANRRLIACFVVAVVIIAVALPMVAQSVLGLSSNVASLAVILLLPSMFLFNYRVASMTERCQCGTPKYLFMGLLGRSYCYRCSTCGRLLRLRD